MLSAPDRAIPSDQPTGHASWALAPFATPSRALALLLVYLTVHSVIRLWLQPSNLGVDDAEQSLFAQAWSLGYRFEQPPLYTWVLLTVTEFTGFPVNLDIITIVRSFWLFVLHAAFFLAARLWLQRNDLAALASAALACTYTLGYLAHGDLTHSTLLAVATAVSLWLWTRLLQCPTRADFLLFGLICGLGVLAKWNFVLLAAAFWLTALAEPAGRRAVLSLDALFAVVLGCAVALAPALWVVFEVVSLQGLAGGVLVEPGAKRFGAVMVDGGFELVKSTLAFPQPWLIVALAVCGTALWRHSRNMTPSSRPLWRLMAIAWLLHAILIPTLGAVNFPERWMIPILLPLPIAVLALLRDPDAHAARQRLATATLVLLATAAVARIAVAFVDDDNCKKCRLQTPFRELAAALPGPAGTIVVDDMHLGGNVSVLLDGRVVMAGTPPSIWPAPGDSGCLVVWRHGAGGGAKAMAATLGADLIQALEGSVVAPLPGGQDREVVLSYLWLPAGSGDCR